MNFKKLFALIMALVMVTALLSACGDKPEDDTTAISGQLFVNGEEIDTAGLVMMTVDGVEVPFDEFRYMYMVLDNSYFSGGDQEFWASNADVFSLLLGYTSDYVVENNWGYMLANKYGIDFTDEDLEQIDAALVDERSYFESDEEFDAALEEAGFTEDLLRRIIAQQIMCNRVYDELYAKDGAPLVPSDEEIKTALSEDYVRVYHVLVANDHFADAEGYEDANDEELKEAARAYAEELREQILNGEDIYELAQIVGDDPGMIGNEDGYFFTYDKMVKPFEEAAFALEVGGISDIVEYDYYGYFVIMRLEQDEYIEENWETVRSNYVDELFNNDISEMIANAEIVYSEYYDQLTYDSIR